MSNILKITCPKCKVIFDAGDAFNTHFKNAQIESEKKLKEADLFPYFLLFDIGMFFYYLIFAFSIFKKPSKTWK